MQNEFSLIINSHYDSCSSAGTRIPRGHTYWYSIQLECTKSLWVKWNVWHLTFSLLKCIVGPRYGGFVLLWMITCMICRGRCSIHFWNGSQSQYPIFLYYACEYLHFANPLYFPFLFFFSFFSLCTTSIIFHYSFLQLPLLPFPFFPPLLSSLLLFVSIISCFSRNVF